MFMQLSTETYNDGTYKSLMRPRSALRNRLDGIINRPEGFPAALSMPFLPLTYLFRGLDSRYYQGLRNFVLTGRAANVGGRICIEVAKDKAPGFSEVFWLDRERDYVVVRKTITERGFPTWQLDVTYAPDAIVGWVPNSWDYIIRGGKANIIAQSGRSVVRRYEINPDLSDSDFDVVFPPRTRVTDLSSGKEVQYVIQEGGEKGVTISGRKHPTYEQLDKPVAARTIPGLSVGSPGNRIRGLAMDAT